MYHKYINTMGEMADREKYVPTRKAVEILGVHVLTLHNWEKAKKIDTIKTGGGHRLYNVDKYLRENGKKYNDNTSLSSNSDENVKDKPDKKKKILTKKHNEQKECNTEKKCKEKENICYIRVPSVSNKKLLKNEKDYMKNKYPKYTIVEDIGSSLNFNKDGFKKIIDLAVAGKINNLIITDVNVIPKYGYDMLDYLIKKHSGGKIIVDSCNKGSNKQINLIDDITQILGSCVSKLSELKTNTDFDSE